ncbi:keratin, type I cytoskeletal 19-like [Cottoperca gobio]|uniref:Keratin, type I cytoskeletal 19-like n=1 Tax=Cottoperca gobio TaxID=56716 RepID=A0A6J2PN50_COTGO|nr:keratin, type I cytoskeletal 19-like [Cottoperca gobio]
MNGYRCGSIGWSQSSLPSKAGSRRAKSVYGGADCRSVRVSYPCNNLGSGLDLTGTFGCTGVVGNNWSICGSEKFTLQNLNDRLAVYLEKVRTLECANAQLERQIRDWCQQHTLTVRDYSKYLVIIDELRRKITAATHDNAKLMLQIDNARLAAEDFRVKYENEMAVRMSVEADIAGLRRVLDDLTCARGDLEMKVEGLREELIYLKKNHEEELVALRGQVYSSTVNVEVDAKPQSDLSSILGQIRSQYESISEKNRIEMDVWYKVKFEDLNTQVTTNSQTLQCSRTEIHDLKRTLQALQIELQSQHSQKSALEGQLSETECRYSMQLNQLQSLVDSLECELQEMRRDIERQSNEYQVLLDIKTRLELEIAEYRRLLDGGDVCKTLVTQQQHITDVKPQQVTTQRKTIVIEEIVNGQVVSRIEEVK